MEQRFKVFETKNYSMFKFLNSNRLPNQRLINQLKESISEIGLQAPIILNEDHEIVDGQHRFWALRELKFPVYYMISKAWRSSRDTAAMNSVQKSWNTLNFAWRLAQDGNIEMQNAFSIAEKWKSMTSGRLKEITSFEILLKKKTHSGMLNLIKNESYEIDVENGHKIFDVLFIMNEYKMKASPFSAIIARSIKKLYFVKNGLNHDAIRIMCTDNYIQNYNKENDQFEYFKDEYSKALRKVKK